MAFPISREYWTKECKAAGVRITSIGKTGTLHQMMVGESLLSWDSAHGGKGCWAVRGIRVGRVGEAIMVAFHVETGFRPPLRSISHLCLSAIEKLSKVA